MIRIVELTDAMQLTNVADDVFDDPVNPDLTAEFVSDPRHHMLLAVDDPGADEPDAIGRITAMPLVVGFCSGVHYIHPDKPTELWLNELGVDQAYQRQGIASRLIAEMRELGRELGAVDVWVLAEKANKTAQSFYESIAEKEPAEECILYAFSIKSDPKK